MRNLCLSSHSSHHWCSLLPSLLFTSSQPPSPATTLLPTHPPAAPGTQSHRGLAGWEPWVVAAVPGPAAAHPACAAGSRGGVGGRGESAIQYWRLPPFCRPGCRAGEAEMCLVLDNMGCAPDLALPMPPVRITTPTYPIPPTPVHPPTPHPHPTTNQAAHRHRLVLLVLHPAQHAAAGLHQWAVHLGLAVAGQRLVQRPGHLVGWGVGVGARGGVVRVFACVSVCMSWR